MVSRGRGRRGTTDGHRGRTDTGQPGSERGQGRARGRGQGELYAGGPLKQEKAQILTARRPSTMRIAGEGTDDIIIASPGSKSLQMSASLSLTNRSRSAPTTLGTQKDIRTFISSCLLNLSNHHSVDTSGLLWDLTSDSGRALLAEILVRPMAIDVGGDDDGSVISFQYVVLPLIGVLTRESVCLSMMSNNVEQLYATVYSHREQFLEQGVMRCMNQLLDRGSFFDSTLGASQLIAQDTTVCNVASVQHALLAITRLIYQLLRKLPGAAQEMAVMIDELSNHHMRRLEIVDCEDNQFLSEMLDRETVRLLRIVEESRELSLGATAVQVVQANQSTLAHRYSPCDPPGELSPKGPRHDNDHGMIADISVLPTSREITCARAPFLPFNGAPDADHFLSQGWRRQLDIHFRLYREDLLHPLRQGIKAFLEALEVTAKGNEEVLMDQRELRKMVTKSRDPSDSHTVDLHVYGRVQFLGMESAKANKGSANIRFLQPYQARSRAYATRSAFWQNSRARLMQGAMVFLVGRSNNSPTVNSTWSASDVALAVVTRRETADLARDETYAGIQISLADPRLYVLLMAPQSSQSASSSTYWFLVEPMGGFFEGYRPILQALQSVVPATLPFGRYLAPTKGEEDEQARRTSAGESVDPPAYAQAPGFAFDLSTLLKGRECHLYAGAQDSMENAVNVLQSHSTLDDTQAKALVETLCREVALISGPPGTGKTKIGVDLMKVLLSNKDAINCGPILCICYTNHALDQFLEHLLDEGIDSIVRLGGGSKSDRLEAYKLEVLAAKKYRPYSTRSALHEVKNEWGYVSAEMKALEWSLRSDYMPWQVLQPHLAANHPDLCRQFEQRINNVFKEAILDFSDSEDDFGGLGQGQNPGASFTIIKARKPAMEHLYDRWVLGQDIADKKRWNERVSEMKSNVRSDLSFNMFDVLGEDWDEAGQLEDETAYIIPDRNRPLALLNGDVWAMSMPERVRLQESWRAALQSSRVASMERLLQDAERICEMKNGAYNDMRRKILSQRLVIGMTTNGAAKQQALLNAVAPKVIVCEEAGEVLESHILATLSSSVQHLILIGDHLQLRPSIETYQLSSDSKVGENYKLDMSLFERLVTAKKNPMPMSSLTIQRRMRPEISSLIRNTLYPRLENGPNVLEYPSVNGMDSNLYFMDHAHSEDSKDQLRNQSFANSFEIEMVVALTRYLIKNGYEKRGDIAILTPYLGQLGKLRDHLKGDFVELVSEKEKQVVGYRSQRDESDSDLDSEDLDARRKRISVCLQDHVTVRTIDNYQGEEAKIVIISLVRSDAMYNGGTCGSGSIGFLKSPNRTNVLLSRAQHGMYIIGHAGLMEGDGVKNGLWPQIIPQLRDSGQLSDGFPIRCKNHPQVVRKVTAPDMLKAVAPNGGCMAPCQQVMTCGHVCPFQCHPDDPRHVAVKCSKPCRRVHDKCGHSCQKQCYENCGPCVQVVPPISLSCGHILQDARCYQAEDPLAVACPVKNTLKLATCEHVHIVDCTSNLFEVVCHLPCGLTLGCGHVCTRACHECQQTSVSHDTDISRAPLGTNISERVHGRCKESCEQLLVCGHTCDAKCHPGQTCPPCQHACGQRQVCGHACASTCHSGSSCSPCRQPCKASCGHSRCSERCGDPCASCCKPCDWKCDHQGPCGMPCGAPCSRLPCNERCDKVLACGHPCPSICGEDCPPSRFCPECAVIEDLMDLMTLGDERTENDPILIPACGHGVTMSRLDEMMELGRFYEGSTDHKTGENRFLATKDLPETEVASAACPVCKRKITGLRRYGRRLKFERVSQESKAYQISQMKCMVEAQHLLESAHRRVEQEQSSFLNAISQTINKSCGGPPAAPLRILGKYMTKTAELPNSNFMAISKIYDIPMRQEEAWQRLVKPLLEPFHEVTKIHQENFKSATKLLFDAAVSLGEKMKRSSRSYRGTQGQQRDAERVMTGVSEEVQSRLVKCGLPRDGHAGPSFVDSMQRRTSILMIVLSVGMSALCRVGATSGWYWFLEDLIRCVNTHIVLLEKAAQEGGYPRKAVSAKLMRLDLVCFATEWLAARPVPGEGNARKQRMRAIEGMKEQFERGLGEAMAQAPELFRMDLQKRAKALEERMELVMEVTVGKGGYLTRPIETKAHIFMEAKQTTEAPYRWCRCSNGHTYIVQEHIGRSLGQSGCPECM